MPASPMITDKWVTNYTVVRYSHLPYFDEEVQRRLTAKWQPYGPLMIAEEDGELFYVQAMVQYSSRPGLGD